MKRTMLFVIPALLFSTLLAGCYRQYGTEPDRTPVAEYPKIATLGWLRNDFFQFDAPIVTPEQGNRPMQVTVSVRLKELAFEERIACQYRFIFFDERGVPLNPEPMWHFRLIEPRVATYLQAGAPDTGAVDWRCEIRENLDEEDQQ